MLLEELVELGLVVLGEGDLVVFVGLLDVVEEEIVSLLLLADEVISSELDIGVLDAVWECGVDVERLEGLLDGVLLLLLIHLLKVLWNLECLREEWL